MLEILDTLFLLIRLLGLERATKDLILDMDPFSNMLEGAARLGSESLSGIYLTYFETYAFLMAMGLMALIATMLLNPRQIFSSDRGIGLGIGAYGMGNALPGTKGYTMDKMFSGLNGILPNFGGTIIEWLVNVMIKPWIYIMIAYVMSIFSLYMLTDVMLGEIIVSFIRNPMMTVNMVLGIGTWYSSWIMIHMILVIMGLFCIPLIEVGNMYNSTIARAAGRVFDVNLFVPFLMTLCYSCGLMLWNGAGEGGIASVMRAYLGMGLSSLASLIPILLIVGASLMGLIEIIIYILMLVFAKVGIPMKAVGTAAQIAKHGLTRVAGTYALGQITRADGRKSPETIVSNKPRNGGV